MMAQTMNTSVNLWIPKLSDVHVTETNSRQHGKGITGFGSQICQGLGKVLEPSKQVCPACQRSIQNHQPVGPSIP